MARELAAALAPDAAQPDTAAFRDLSNAIRRLSLVRAAQPPKKVPHATPEEVQAAFRAMLGKDVVD